MSAPIRFCAWCIFSPGCYQLWNAVIACAFGVVVGVIGLLLKGGIYYACDHMEEFVDACFLLTYFCMMVTTVIYLGAKLCWFSHQVAEYADGVYKDEV